MFLSFTAKISALRGKYVVWNVVILVFVFILKSKYQAKKLTPSSIFNKIEIVVIPIQKVWQEKMHGVASSRTIKLKSR